MGWSKDCGRQTFEFSKRFGDRAQHQGHALYVAHVDATLTRDHVLSQLLYRPLQITTIKPGDCRFLNLTFNLKLCIENAHRNWDKNFHYKSQVFFGMKMLLYLHTEKRDEHFYTCILRMKRKCSFEYYLDIILMFSLDLFQGPLTYFSPLLTSVSHNNYMWFFMKVRQRLNVNSSKIVALVAA